MGRYLLFLLLTLGAAGGCATAAPTPPPDPRPTTIRSMTFVVEDFARGSREAEAFLAAMGPDAVPWLLPLLGSENPEVRLRTLGLLVDSGEDIDVTLEERVELLLYEVSRVEAPGWSSLRAIGRLRQLEPEARPLIEAAAAREDAVGRAARLLLQRWEVPQ